MVESFRLGDVTKIYVKAYSGIRPYKACNFLSILSPSWPLFDFRLCLSAPSLNLSNQQGEYSSKRPRQPYNTVTAICHFLQLLGQVSPVWYLLHQQSRNFSFLVDLYHLNKRVTRGCLSSLHTLKARLSHGHTKLGYRRGIFRFVEL